MVYILLKFLFEFVNFTLDLKFYSSDGQQLQTIGTDKQLRIR